MKIKKPLSTILALGCAVSNVALCGNYAYAADCEFETTYEYIYSDTPDENGNYPIAIIVEYQAPILEDLYFDFRSEEEDTPIDYSIFDWGDEADETPAETPAVVPDETTSDETPSETQTTTPDETITVVPSEPVEVTPAPTEAVKETPKRDEPTTYEVDMGKHESVEVEGYYNDYGARKVFDQLNEYRVANGLKPLKWNDDMAPAADTRAIESTIDFSHQRPNGKMFNSLDTKNMHGENLAMGYSSADSVMKAWQNSEVHNANLLDPNYESVSISCFVYYQYNQYGQRYKTYAWVQNFSCK